MTAGGTAGLRERKKLETRTSLRRAAVRLYLEHGPSAVTVQDICEAAGVSPRTFFNYFDTKDDAVFDWDQRLTCQLVETLETLPANETPLSALHHAIAVTLPVLVEDPDWHTRGAVLRENPELAPKLVHNSRRMEDALTRAMARRTGEGEDALRPRLLAGCGLVALRTALVGWTPDNHADGLLALLDEAFAALASGLPGPTPEASGL